MAIGDVKSMARGSGVRLNDGKAPLELLPLRVVAEGWLRAVRNAPDRYTPEQRLAVPALFSLADWQEGGDERPLYSAVESLGTPWHDCARVFDYGRQTKYTEWNWAKGMPWSVPLGSAARHLEAIFAGEECDTESGLPHRGHFTCNVAMLLVYRSIYPEGDDRPILLASKGAA